jgi:hypothetical protein
MARLTARLDRLRAALAPPRPGLVWVTGRHIELFPHYLGDDPDAIVGDWRDPARPRHTIPLTDDRWPGVSGPTTPDEGGQS